MEARKELESDTLLTVLAVLVDMLDSRVFPVSMVDLIPSSPAIICCSADRTAGSALSCAMMLSRIA
jgi:hypothetical protein